MRQTWILLITIIIASPSHAEISEALVLKMKKSVVNIEKSTINGLNVETAGRSHGTGFIVDAKKGIVATNRHVSGTSPTQVKVTFENGESTDAKILYYDSWHDFAFYQLDLSRIDFPLQQVRFGSSFGLKEQNEVFMIGNNEVAEYSVKFGRVTNLYIDKGDRHSATFQTSFDRAGGSSGSPVMNAKGDVVGIHYKGNATTSFEMRIEYVIDSLNQVAAGTKVQRGETGLELDLIHISDARKHYHLPTLVSKEIQMTRKDIKQMVYVERVIVNSKAFGKLLPGDMVVEVDGELVGDDLYLFDKIVNQNVAGTVKLTVYRNGKRMEIPLEISDAEKTKVTRFATFAGGVLHELTPELRRRYEIESNGVFLSQANKGTSFSKLGWGDQKHPTSYVVVLEELNGVKTPTLDAFIAAAKTLKHDQKIYALLSNKRSYRSNTGTVKITLDLKYTPLKVFQYDPKSLDWKEVQL